jgi:REP element-mobilizing transposase RayT
MRNTVPGTTSHGTKYGARHRISGCETLDIERFVSRGNFGAYPNRMAPHGASGRAYARRMAPRPRIEYANAVYHVTVRGDRREPIFADDHDRLTLLRLIADTLPARAAHAYAYCLMGNHFHLVLRTAEPNLSAVMHRIDGEFTRAYNRRHGTVGHVFQGRYHDVIVDADSHLLTVCRYVDANPVRAGLVESAVDWHWSSHRAHLGLTRRPGWLDSGTLHSLLVGREIAGIQDRREAIDAYRRFVDEAANTRPWRQDVRSG